MKSGKHTIQLSIIFILSIFFSFGQDITPKDAFVQFDGKSRASLDVMVEADPKDLKKAWSSFLKEHHDVKLSGIGLFSNKDILTAEEVMIPTISSDAMDFYTKIVVDQNQTKMSVFAAHGYDIYINQADYPQEYTKMKHIMSDFLDEYVTQMYADRIKVLEEEIDDKVKEENDLKKAVKDNNESISELEKEIKEKNEKITEKKKAMVENKASLEAIESTISEDRQELKVLQSKLKAVQNSSPVK